MLFYWPIFTSKSRLLDFSVVLINLLCDFSRNSQFCSKNSKFWIFRGFAACELTRKTCIYKNFI